MISLCGGLKTISAQYVVDQDLESLTVGAVSVSGATRENCAAWSQCNNGVCPPVPLAVSSNQAREGSKSLRFEFNQNNWILHGDGYCALRNEIRWDVDLLHGEEAWYGFSVYPTLGEGGSVKYNSTGDSWICQIKNECGSGNRGGLQIKGDNFYFDGSNLATVNYNQWNDVVIHYKYSSSAGSRKVWINGVQVLSQNYNTQTSSCKIDFKIGMYGWQPSGKTVMYFDAIKVKRGAGTYSDVAPGQGTTPPPPPGCGNPVPWTNNSFATQTGTFTAEFDVVPGGANMDGVVGLTNGSASAYSSLACAVQFNTDGKIYARNGSAYAAANSRTYAAGTSYRVRMVVNVSTRKYDIYVTPSGGSQVTLGTGYSFRTEQASVTQLNNRAMISITCGLAVSNFVIGSVSVPVTGVTVSPTTVSIVAGATQQLTATVSPTNATNKTVTWSSSNTSIATVSSAGVVTGVAAGSATITVTTQDGSKTATSAITVTSAPVANLLVNGGIESRTTSWTGNSCTISATTAQKQEGTSSLSVTARAGNWAGAEQNILTILNNKGQGDYYASAYVKMQSTSMTARITIKIKVNGMWTYHILGSVAANTTSWSLVEGTKNITWSGTLEAAAVYVEGTSTANFWMDNVWLVKGTTKSAQVLLSTDNLATNDALVQVYPNPAKESVNIDIRSYPNSAMVRIYNITGKLVYQHQHEASVFTLHRDVLSESGIYIITVNDGNTLAKSKFQIVK